MFNIMLEILLDDHQEVNMAYKLKSQVVSVKRFIYENLRRITSQCTLLYLNLARILCTLQELFITIILDIYIKFGKKGRLVEKSGC